MENVEQHDMALTYGDLMNNLNKYTEDTLGTQMSKTNTLADTEKLSLSIGGISFSILCRDARFLDQLQARYQWFVWSGPTTYEILIQLVPLSELNFNNDGKSPHPMVARTTSEDNFIISWAHNPFIAVVNIFTKKVLVKMWENEYCFDGFLRALYTLVLAGEGGLLLQAASVTDGNRGRVFFGPSESGKTTIARLAQGRRVLTDELALIKPWNGKYRVYGTPFWGEFTPGRSNTHAELTGLYILKKDQENRIVPVNKAQAVTELYRSVLFFCNELPLLNRILEICCNLVDTTPVHELHFRPDHSFWEVVDERS